VFIFTNDDESRLLRHLQESPRSEFAEQLSDISLAASWLYLIFGYEDLTDGRNGRRLLKELPDSRADFFEPVVHAILQIEDDKLGPKLAVKKFACGDDSGRVRNGGGSHKPRGERGSLNPAK